MAPEKGREASFWLMTGSPLEGGRRRDLLPAPERHIVIPLPILPLIRAFAMMYSSAQISSASFIDKLDADL
jgi:hypothetical protein